MLKRSFGDGDDAGAFGDERDEHSKTIGCIVVKVLGSEAERCEFVHCPAVILVAAVAITEIEVTNSGGVLLNTSELCHIGVTEITSSIYVLSRVTKITDSTVRF